MAAMSTIDHLTPVPEGALDDPPMTFEEVTAFTRLSRSYVKVRVKSGELPSLKMGPHRGSRRLFLRSDVEAFMASHRVGRSS